PGKARSARAAREPANPQSRPSSLFPAYLPEDLRGRVEGEVRHEASSEERHELADSADERRAVEVPGGCRKGGIGEGKAEHVGDLVAPAGAFRRDRTDRK